VTRAGTCGDLIFTREIFLYLSDQEILVSPDRSRWTVFGDMAGIKELFGGGTSELQLGMSADKASGPLLEIGVTVHPQEM
jgi:hypothetical protein